MAAETPSDGKLAVIDAALEALKIESKTEAFMGQLRERIAQLGGDDCRTTAAVRALTESNDPFLTDDGFDENALFSRQWPKTLQLEDVMNAFIALTATAREKDTRLQKRADKLTRKTGEAEFWRRYFGNVYQILFQMSPSIDEQLYRHLANLPPARPLEQRAFTPASKLQRTGRMKRNEILNFLTQCRNVVLDKGTLTALVKLYVGKGNKWDNECNALLMCLQLEYMESLGFERAYGITQIYPAALEQRFGQKDGEVMQALGMFMGACNNIFQLVAQQVAIMPDADPANRRYKPAATLQDSGEVSVPRLLEVVRGLESLNDVEGRRLLISAAKGEGQPVGGDPRDANPRNIYYRWQREFLESQGLAHEFGMQAVYQIPSRVAKQQQPPPDGDGGAGSGGDVAALGFVFDKMKSMSDAFIDSAMIEATRPPEVPVSERRFTPKEGELQSEGELERDAALSFLAGVRDMLMSDETLELASQCEGEGQAFMKAAGMLAITWQREYLEHIGIQQDFGCQALARIPKRFGSDRQVAEAFQEFQKACMYCVQKARVTKEVREAQQRAKEKAALAEAAEVN